MSGGKGGGADTGPMLEYGDKALELQKEQYKYAKDVSKPWLNTGTSAIKQLGVLMGLSDGMQTRDQLYSSMAPQYTTTETVSSAPSGLYTNKKGEVFSPTNYDFMYKQGLNMTPADFYEKAKDPNWMKLHGFSAVGGGSTMRKVVDKAALNAAVDAAYAAQTPSSDYGSLLKTFTPSDLYEDPSYKWRLEQGQKAAERQLAASGKYLTPAASQALTELGQNMGSQEYQAAYNRFNQDQSNIYNRLANLAGMGQTQTGQVIGAGANYANAAGDLYTGMGNAITAANQANAANSSSMFNTLLGTAGGIASSYFLGGAGGGVAPNGINWISSDERLKNNIEPLGQENGHNVYEFSYNGVPDKRYIGVMAQEVQKTNPDAVREIDGYLSVDYDKIGVKFREA